MRLRSPRHRAALLAATLLASTLPVAVPPAATLAGAPCVVTNIRTAETGTSVGLMEIAAVDGDTLTIEGTCTLDDLYLRKRLTFKGVGDAAKIKSPADNRVMNVDGVKATIRNLTLVGGRPYDNGGVLRVYGGARVTLRQVTVTGGIVEGSDAISPAGGGIWVNDCGTTLTVHESLIHGNRVTSTTLGRAAMGGGLWVGGCASVSLVNTTIAENTATSKTYSAEGGGIWVIGSLSLLHVTIADNEATNKGGSGREQGGGIHQGSGTVTVEASIIARNSAGAGPDCFGDYVSDGHNLIRMRRGCQGFIDGTKHDIVGARGAPINPGLGSLNDNGGPTKTITLGPESPALDAAGSAPCARAQDQRGVARPQGPRCDIGALERVP